VYSEELETRYLMLSVSLDEAIGLRNAGSWCKLSQIVIIIPTLCGRLTVYLEAMLNTLEECSENCAVVPVVAPLDPANFQGKRGRRSAMKSSLLSHVLVSQRSQFLNKIRTLRKMVNYMGDNFCDAANELNSQKVALQTQQLWAEMDFDHFDLNTCLRESLILLKCFLRVLPDEQLAEFQQTVSIQLVPERGQPGPTLAQRQRGSAAKQHATREPRAIRSSG
jgi:hypothetical protein